MSYVKKLLRTFNYHMWDTHKDKILELDMIETFVQSMNSTGEYQMHT